MRSCALKSMFGVAVLLASAAALSGAIESAWEETGTPVYAPAAAAPSGTASGVGAGGLPLKLNVNGAAHISADGVDFDAVLRVVTPGRCHGEPDGGFINCNGIAVAINGDLFGDHWLVAGLKAFCIDHPQDPQNRLLMHTSIESDRLRNLYDGIVTCDDTGSAIVQLPGWMEALNGDFRYQLTCLGGSAAVYVAEEIHDNRFKIAGGRPGLRVSWQVTGVRHDPFAQQYAVPTESAKPRDQRGKYVHPELYGQPPEMSLLRAALGERANQD